MFTCRSGILACLLSLTLVGAGFSAHAADDHAKTKKAKEASSGFIYLDDGSGTQDLPPLFVDDTARSPEGILSDQENDKAPFYILDRSAGVVALAGQNDTARALPQQQASFQFGYGRLEPDSMLPSGFGVWLSSEITVQAPPRFGALGSLDEYSGFEHSSYNLGLGIGYNGFSVGASLRQEHDALDAGLSGFDIGLTYQGNRWFTNIQYAGYHNQQNPLFYSFLGDRRLQGIEVGAGYALWPGLTFSGRFKYFDYSNPLFPDAGPDQEHVFTLGTRLNF